MADEPFRGLDPRDTDRVGQAFRRIAHGGAAVVVTGHELGPIRSLADAVVWCVARTTRQFPTAEAAWSDAQLRELWTARADAYLLERWGPDGAVRQVVGREVPWFPGPPTTVDLRRKPSPPSLSGLMVDAGPALWVFVAETRLPFQPPVVTRPDGRQEVDLDLWLSRRDTRIEVLDPRRGTVVAATTHRGLLCVNHHPKLPSIRHVKVPTWGEVTPHSRASWRGGVARHGVCL